MYSHSADDEQQALRAIERRIVQLGNRDLDVLERAGIKRKSLLSMLALVAVSDGSWKEQMRSRVNALRQTATRLEKAGKDAENTATDPLSSFDFWLCIAGGGYVLGMSIPTALAKRDPAAPFLMSGIRVCAKYYRDEARRFATYLRKFGQTDPKIVLLLHAIQIWTRSTQHRDDHYEALARLLTDAFEAAGRRKSFSAAGLRKTAARHVTRMIRLIHLRKKALQSANPSDLPGIVLKASQDSPAMYGLQPFRRVKL